MIWERVGAETPNRMLDEVVASSFFMTSHPELLLYFLRWIIVAQHLLFGYRLKRARILSHVICKN
jgi:hypothetical protein